MRQGCRTACGEQHGQADLAALLLLEGSPGLSHISTLSCFCAKARLHVCYTVLQERETGGQGDISLGTSPLVLLSLFSWNCPSHMVGLLRPLYKVLFPQATVVQGSQHVSLRGIQDVAEQAG